MKRTMEMSRAQNDTYNYDTYNYVVCIKRLHYAIEEKNFSGVRQTCFVPDRVIESLIDIMNDAPIRLVVTFERSTAYLSFSLSDYD